ncbi:zeta toxin family protein [Litoribacter alkaliphilus]|uniref:Zeta toxin family protein n=1 Tax=Litoribacter ruber TaxID=702568 RepID=A0AAP2G0T9_9BACT|nr:zeta toxin family protein [Litoribacter alkaliphilus]MBS9523444.1 zeta toxin family protein [Litoribacter alkaliphilus]
MDKPQLLIVAGCNGSGKSSYSNAFTPEGVVPFDYDQHFLGIYNSLVPTEFQDTMAHNKAFAELERQIQNAWSDKSPFCYETNFNSTPLYWPARFKQKGYEINMVYFFLNSIAEAKRRVAIRVENGGHFVPEKEIEQRFYDGYSNLNINLSFFDNLHLFDSSRYKKEPQYCLSLANGKLAKFETCPDHIIKYIPKLKELGLR